MSKIKYGYETEERDRGVISEADRKFLFEDGENLKNDNVRKNTRRRIRNRVVESVIDFEILSRLLDEGDMRQIFRVASDESNPERQMAFRAGMKSMIEFLYVGLGLDESDLDFSAVLESGVHDAEVAQQGGPVTISVNFDVEKESNFDLERAKRRYEDENQSLTVSEVGALLALGVVDDEDEILNLAERAQERATFPATMPPMLEQYMRDEFDLDFADGSKVHVPTPGTTDGDRIGDFTERMVRSETIPMRRIHGFDTAEDNESDDEADDVE